MIYLFQVILSYYLRETRISLFILQISTSNESLGFEVNAIRFLLFQKIKSLSEFSKAQNALIAHKRHLLLKLKSYKKPV